MSANELYGRCPDCGFIAPPEAASYGLTADGAIDWSRPAHATCLVCRAHHDITANDVLQADAALSCQRCGAVVAYPSAAARVQCTGCGLSLTGPGLSQAQREELRIAEGLSDLALRVTYLAATRRAPRRAGGVSASEDRDTERARLHEMMAVSEAEGTVTAARMTELTAAQDRAWRRHQAAKGLLSRARKDGSAQKIAAAAEHERQAYAEADQTARAAIEEMLAINGGRLNALGKLNEQIGRTWAADTQVLDEIRDTEPEAGQ